MKISKVLEQAKSLIEEYGWGQFEDHHTRYEDGNKCNFCMAGAIYNVLQDYHSKYTTAAMKILSGAIDANYTNLPAVRVMRYNDEDGRTKEEVLDVFDRAITIAKSEESAVDAPRDT